MKSISKKQYSLLRHNGKNTNINVVLKVARINTIKGLQGLYRPLFISLSLSLSLPFSSSGREKDNRRRWRVVGTRQASRVHDEFSRWPCSFHDQLFAARAPSCHIVGVSSPVPPLRVNARARFCRRVGGESITLLRSTRYSDNAPRSGGGDHFH